MDKRRRAGSEAACKNDHLDDQEGDDYDYESYDDDSDYECNADDNDQPVCPR